MGWFSDRWAVLEISMGPRRFLLVPIVVAVVAGVDWVIAKLSEVGLGSLIGVPSWAIGLYAATLLVLWWVVEYCVKLKKQITGGRSKLSKLRTEGVRIRNSGYSKFSDEKSWLAWKKEAEDWEQHVIAALREINEADAEWFKILDVVPGEARIKFYKEHDPSDPHETLYRGHDFRLMRLGEMIRELWRGDR